MAATATPSSNLSPRYSSAENVNSVPIPRRSRAVSSPWAQIVRGPREPEPVPVQEAVYSSPSSTSDEDVDLEQKIAPAPSSDSLLPKAFASAPSADDVAVETPTESSEGADSNSNAGKRPAWNKPSNGAVDVGPVMGAVSWPALSEAARVSAKSPSDSSKPLNEGSQLPISQGTGVANSAAPLPQKLATNNANPNSTQNTSHPMRQRSFKRGGSVNLPANNGPVQASVAQSAGVEAPQGTPSPRDHAHKGANWDSGQRGSQAHAAHDHPQQRNSFRRGNGGPHPRGDGSYHHNYGGRRDHERGNHDWNPNRNYNGRDAHIQPQRIAPRGFVRPPPPHAAPFVAPPPVRPFGNPIGFEMASPVVYIPHEPFRGVPFIAPIPPHAMMFPAMDPQLHAKIVTQIEYYFSNENLVKDTYLRQNMDDQGWVPVKLIAGFNKVRSLTDNMQLILDALRTSLIVEVQGDKLRRRHDWMKWIMPSAQFSTISGSQSLGSPSHDPLASRVQDIALEETTNSSITGNVGDVCAEEVDTISSSQYRHNGTQNSENAEMDQSAAQIASGCSISSSNLNEKESC